VSVDRTLRAEPLTAAAFDPFGDVIDMAGHRPEPINDGMCDRFHDLARTEVVEGRLGLSLLFGRPYALPLSLRLLERHPFGSQAFMPLSPDPFLVVVAEDAGGEPVGPRAFLTLPGQGVNYLRGIWHAVLTPIGRPAAFLVADRIGAGPNLEEHRFDRPWTVTARSA
jgi:ureidoglycolate lyase